MSRLRAQQAEFVLMVADLIQWTFNQPGYELSFGEAYRTPEQAALNAAKGTGITNSLHTKRLAIDFNLFINGIFQTGTEAYRPLGEHWKSKGGSWGGDFSRPDGNHFSLEWEGVR